MKRVFAVGDVHGHLDRLEALLKQEGIIDDEGKRIDDDVTVVQLGDLGHFGITGSPTGDELCYLHVARDRWCDIVLWGNHDRAVISAAHAFGGYNPPGYTVKHLMKRLIDEKRMRLAYASHGMLLTHAGLHKSFKYNDVPDDLKTDPEALAEWLNTSDLLDSTNKTFVAIRDNISFKRYGQADAGGILWRDANESLYTGFRQVFGHTKGDKVRKYHGPDGWSYCIDIGSPTNGELAGIWLPDGRAEVKV